MKWSVNMPMYCNLKVWTKLFQCVIFLSSSDCWCHEIETDSVCTVCERQTGTRLERNDSNEVHGFKSCVMPGKSSFSTACVVDLKRHFDKEEEIDSRNRLHPLPQHHQPPPTSALVSPSLLQRSSQFQIFLCSSYTGKTSFSAMATYWRKI